MFHRESRIDQTLLQLSDPQPSVDRSSASKLKDNEWLELLALANDHGVLGIVLHHLDPERHADRPAWKTAERCWRAESVLSMRLRQYGKQLIDALSAAGVQAAIFKGADFADHLYPQPNLRPARDIDLLIPRDEWQAAARVFESLDYVKDPGLWDKYAAGEYAEETWRPCVSSEITVELHWNLIRSPSLRRRASVVLADLDRTTTTEGRGICGEFSPVSRLLIATVHAAHTHQFDRLLLLCDIREACRRLSSETEVERLRELAQRTRTFRATVVALDVTARLLNDPASARISRQLGGGGTVRAGARVISRNMVLRASHGWSSLRRHLVREWLKRAA
jgi:Uncharacterised nucleotidyltransferase